jgi:hypothetical protein
MTTTSSSKFTKHDLFTSLLDLVKTTNPENADLLINGLENELALLARKAATPRKPTATQVENESLKAELVSFLVAADMPKTIKEIQTECAPFAELSNQRISHLLSALGADGKVEKSYVKKTPYFNAK